MQQLRRCWRQSQLHWTKVTKHASGNYTYEDHLLNVNISMTVGLIFTKIGSFIENRQIFMTLNCNCTMPANFEDF